LILFPIARGINKVVPDIDNPLRIAKIPPIEIIKSDVRNNPEPGTEGVSVQPIEIHG
jgi:hypothetical protein